MVCRPLWSPAEAESNKYRERRNMQHDYPILEFDSTLEAMLEPRRIIKPIDIPEHAVACFFQDVITQLSQRHAARVIKHLKSEIGTHPVYELEVEGRRLAVFHPGVAALETVLKAHQVDYLLSKTWTTDALYRETPAKVQLRKAEGCLTVEMEAAAFFAVARFRGVQFAQLLYGGDDLGGSEWDDRNWVEHASVREKLFWLAAEACLLL